MSLPLPKLLALVFLCGAALLAPPLAGADRYALMKLDYALKLANSNALPDATALGALNASTDGAKARDLLLHHFNQRWLNGSAGRLDIPIFERAAAPFSLFGTGNQDLPQLIVKRGSPPAASEDADFLAYLRRALPSGNVSSELLPKLGGVSAGTATVVENFRFLEDVAREGEIGAVSTSKKRIGTPPPRPMLPLTSLSSPHSSVPLGLPFALASVCVSSD